MNTFPTHLKEHLTMKHVFAFLLALAAGLAGAQTYTPAQCVVSYPANNAGQYQLHTVVGAPYTIKTTQDWATAVAFHIPEGPINSASVSFPTAATGSGIAGTTTAYLTIIPATNLENTCAGFGPFYTLSVKPKKDNDLVSLASTVVTPLQTGDVSFPLNAKALGILRGLAGTDVVFGVSMFVPRVMVYPIGEDPKKANQVGVLMDAWRTSPCAGVASPYCPTLITH